jgi:RecA-family ATPase
VILFLLAVGAALKPSDAELSLNSLYLVKGWLDRGAMSVVYGPSNVGKTFFAVDVAYHIAVGRPWHGAFA